MPSSYRDRLLAEAVRNLESDGADPVRDDVAAAAESAARRRGGSLEDRLIERALQLPMAERLREALQRVRSAVLLMSLAGALLGALAGAGAARTSLGEAGSGPVNFFWVLLSLLGVQILLLVVWLLMLLVRPATLVGSSLGGLVVALARRLAGRLERGPEQIAAIRAVGSAWARSPIGTWTLGSVSHAMWLAFNVGLGAMIIVLLSTRQYAFAWETTILSERTYVPLTEAIAAGPRAVGFVVPDRAQIEQSRWRGEGHVPSDDQARASEAWAGLLLGSIVLYGFGPRALLLGLCLSLRRRACARYRLDVEQAGFERLEDRLMPGRRSLGIVDPEETAAPHTLSAGSAPAVRGDAGGPPALVGFELTPAASPWPPPVSGVGWVDLGFVDDGPSRERALGRLRGLRGGEASVVVVCALTTTPDRGVRHFLEDVRASGGRPVGLLLTAGQRLRERTTLELFEQRIDDWHVMARAAGIEDERVLEIDLDHLTGESQARLGAWVNGGSSSMARPGGGPGRLARAFDLVADGAAAAGRGGRRVGGSGSVEQVELHRRIAALYRADRESWCSLLAAPRELSGDVASHLRRSADRVVGLLPARLRLRPRWMAAGALAGALGCVAAATLASPVAIGALPIWSGVGAAIATLLRSHAPGRDDATAADGGNDAGDLPEAVRAAALFAMLLELQGRDEVTIGRVLDGALEDDVSGEPLASAADVRPWLDETRHRFEIVLAQEARP